MNGRQQSFDILCSPFKSEQNYCELLRSGMLREIRLFGCLTPTVSVLIV